jgi:hypothetical protein
MTTTTVPDVDLEAWLAGDLDVVCQVPVDLYGRAISCARAADWLMAFGWTCRCGHGWPSVLCCDGHHDEWVAVSGLLKCNLCDAPAPVTWTERIRP